MPEKEKYILKEHECETSRLHCTSVLTRGILIFFFFSLGASIPTSDFSCHSLAPFSENPLRYRVLEPQLQAWQPRSTFPGYPYPSSSGISTVALRPVHSGYLPLCGMQDPPQQRVQPQNTTPCYLNLEGSAVTYLQEIPGFLPHVECKERVSRDCNRKLRCQMIHISLLLANQPIPSRQLIWKVSSLMKRWDPCSMDFIRKVQVQVIRNFNLVFLLRLPWYTRQ